MMNLIIEDGINNTVSNFQIASDEVNSSLEQLKEIYSSQYTLTAVREFAKGNYTSANYSFKEGEVTITVTPDEE